MIITVQTLGFVVWRHDYYFCFSASYRQKREMPVGVGKWKIF